MHNQVHNLASASSSSNNFVVQIAIPSPLYQHFDYLPPRDLNLTKNDFKFGQRVLVPFGNRKAVGFILGIAACSTVETTKLKYIEKILDAEPLWSASMLELLRWTSAYYHYPLGEVLLQVLPPFLRRHHGGIEAFCDDSGLAPSSHKLADAVKEQNFTLNDEQQAAIDTIAASCGFNTFLLDGVTGSGKTEVYLRVIEQLLEKNTATTHEASKQSNLSQCKQALILVPEINLTPQTIKRFEERFALPIAIIHSKVNTKERFRAWLAAKEGRTPIVIGTRSAIFTPLLNPGIIIVDEEHDLSFKQQAKLRYSARDVAIMRGKLENIPVVLGSATPSLESLANAWQKRYVPLRLSARAGNAMQPRFNIIDMRNQKITEGLTAGLIQAIDEHITKDGQVLLFLNRRGYAPVLLCSSCGWVANCVHCTAHLTLHRRTQKLNCHHCGAIYDIPKECKACKKTSLYALGLGTEKLENVLPTLFPGVSLVRVDSDTARTKNSICKMLNSIHSGENQILIGTQMLAKGHHFPDVSMVAILNVDAGLFGADFRASEHLAQMIMQVAGRAGRAKRAGEVYIQTHYPQHPLLQRLVQHGYHSFAKAALREREEANLPPYNYLAIFRAEAKKQERAIEFLESLKTAAQRMGAKTSANSEAALQVLGPAPAVMERKADHYQMQLIMQSKNRAKLQQLLAQLKEQILILRIPSGLKWSLDVDPVEMV